MQSKTSCFNRTAFVKNLTRFAPVMALYGLLSMLLMLMCWNQVADYQPEIQFMNQVNDILAWAAVLNVGYACLVAQLLFGDLYNSRMCNALHALPLRREAWYISNFLSGLVYSLVPTAVTALVLLPMLMQTVFVDAWKLAGWYFLIANVEYLCLFGIAVFSAMMVGSRFTQVAAYGLVNAGSGILYSLVDTVYTPMLYGVVTPNKLASNLTPVWYMMEQEVTWDRRGEYFDRFGELLPNVQIPWEMGEFVRYLPMLAAVGIVFAVIGLILYHFRNLECAGDAVCSRKLVPLFLVLSAMFVAVASEALVIMVLGHNGNMKYILLFAGLLVGWFAGKMLVERSARVFRLKNWMGLGILAAVLALSLGLNKLDVLGITDRIPQKEDIASVELDNRYTLKDPADIEQILQLHADALKAPLKQEGGYVLEDGEWVYISDSRVRYWEEGDPLPQQKMADYVNLTYTLKNGNTIARRYYIWVDSPAGQIAKKILSRWDVVNADLITVGEGEMTRLDMVLASFQGIDFLRSSMKSHPELNTLSAAHSLLQAIQADCQEGNMVQEDPYHNGVFVWYEDDGVYEHNSLWLSLCGVNYSWGISVYPECRNTIQWMTENGLMEGITILPQGSSPRYY